MKSFIPTFFVGLFFISGCSTAPVDVYQSDNQEVSREVASLLSDCTTSVAAFFKKGSVGQTIAASEIKTYVDWLNFANNPKMLNSKLDMRDIERITNFEFARNLGLGVSLSQELNHHLGKRISEVPYEDILLKILSKKLFHINSTEEVQELVASFKDLLFPEEKIITLFHKIPLVQGVFYKTPSFSDLLNFHASAKDYLFRISASSDRAGKFLSVIEKLKAYQLGEDEVSRILEASPHYKKLLESNPELAKVIKTTLKENSKVFPQMFYDNLGIAFKVLQLDDWQLKSILPHINTNYSFYKILERASKASVEIDLGLILNSPFCKKMACQLSELQSIVERARNGEDVRKIIIDVFPVFNEKKSLSTADNYDIEMPVVQVKDQCSWGSCWMNTGIEKIEFDIWIERGLAIPLSEDYNYILYLRNEYKLALYGKEVKEGNFQQNFDTYINKWGVIPASAWRPQTNFRAQHITQDLRARLERMVKEFQESLKERGEGDKEHLIAQYAKRIDILFDAYFGQMPQKFTFRGKEYTPISFAEEFYPNFNQVTSSLLNPKYVRNGQIDRVSLVEEGRVSIKTQKLKGEEVSVETIVNSVLEDLDDGLIIRADFQWPVDSTFTVKGPNGKTYKEAFVNKKTGELSAPNEKTFVDEDSHHAVLIVGVDFDRHGKPYRLKILNSWGTKSGDQGFYHMDMNFFRSFVVRTYTN